MPLWIVYPLMSYMLNLFFPLVFCYTRAGNFAETIVIVTASFPQQRRFLLMFLNYSQGRGEGGGGGIVLLLSHLTLTSMDIISFSFSSKPVPDINTHRSNMATWNIRDIQVYSSVEKFRSSLRWLWGVNVSFLISVFLTSFFWVSPSYFLYKKFPSYFFQCFLPRFLSVFFLFFN